MKTTAIWCTALLLATVELSAAGTDFDSFLQPDPFVQANAAFARGEAAAAESIIAPLTQGTAPRADACELLSEIRMSQKRLKEGVELFQRAAGELEKRQPLDGAITAASITERLGRLETALASYRKAIQIFSGSPDLLACEPRVLTRLVRTAEARTCYEKILVDFPGWEPARTALAALSPAS